jgi:hypothetical protein
MVVASGILRIAGLSDLHHRRTAELAAPHHERRIQQAPLFEILDQRGGGLIGDVAVLLKVAIQIRVLVPTGVHHQNEPHPRSTMRRASRQLVAKGCVGCLPTPYISSVA